MCSSNLSVALPLFHYFLNKIYCSISLTQTFLILKLFKLTYGNYETLWDKLPLHSISCIACIILSLSACWITDPYGMLASLYGSRLAWKHRAQTSLEYCYISYRGTTRYTPLALTLHYIHF